MEYEKQQVFDAIESIWQNFSNNPDYRLTSKDRGKIFFYVFRNRLDLPVIFEKYLYKLSKERGEFTLRDALSRYNINRILRRNIE